VTPACDGIVDDIMLRAVPTRLQGSVPSAFDQSSCGRIPVGPTSNANNSHCLGSSREARLCRAPLGAVATRNRQLPIDPPLDRRCPTQLLE
jgi:hypothetical protein